MSNLPAILATFFLALAFLAGCSSPASSNPVSEDGFVTIHGGMYTVDCDEQGSGCREVTVDTFEVSQYEVTFFDWSQCIHAEFCKKIGFYEEYGNTALTTVSIRDFRTSYLGWINQYTEKNFRMLSPNEWLVIISILKENFFRNQLQQFQNNSEINITVSEKEIDSLGLYGMMTGGNLALYDEEHNICYLAYHFGLKEMSCDIRSKDITIRRAR
jgi:hypothetical protein